MFEPISYCDIGAGTPVILIHGDFSNGQLAWSSQIRSLADRLRLIVVDRRGHGESTREPRPYTIAADADDVCQVADLIGTDTFHLVGHSYGGLVAMEIARRAPERIRSLHLIEPPYLALLESEPEVARMIARTRDLFGAAATRDHEETAAEFFTIFAGAAAMARIRESPGWPMVVAESRRVADAEHPGDFPTSALDELRHGYPVRVYTGGRSNPVTRRVAIELARRMPGSVLVEISEAFHDVQRAHEPFNGAMLEVIDST